MSIPLDDFGGDHAREARRDRWGRYLVVPPGASKPVGYTRVTTIAKTLDDGGGLLPWKATLAMTGLMRRQGLRAKFEALMSAHPDKGPWYGSADSKKAAKALVEECAQAGGSSDRADLGTALHSIIEQINRGQMPMIVQPDTQADIDAYIAATSHIKIDPAGCEATVVLDEWKVAGTADILHATVPGLGDVIADLKTGDNLTYSWQSIAVQLAAYAHGDNIYRQGDAEDGSADERLPMPKIRQDIAVVIHLPAGQAHCELYTVDIAAGWEAFQHSMWARKWRSNKELATKTSAGEATPHAAPAEPTTLEVARQRMADDSARTPAPKPAKPDEGAEIPEADVAALKKRYAALGDAAKAWTGAVVAQGKEGHSWRINEGKPTVRRFELYRGVMTLAEAYDADGDEIVRAIAHFITGDDAALFPTTPSGLILGTLDAAQAAKFAEIAGDIVRDLYRLVADGWMGGTLRLQPVA